jgi:hypothetical protein
VSREEELVQVREQVGILAEQVGRLLDVILRQEEQRANARMAEDRMAVLESLMWKLHHRHMRLRNDISYGHMSDQTLN